MKILNIFSIYVKYADILYRLKDINDSRIKTNSSLDFELLYYDSYLCRGVEKYCKCTP